MQGDNNGRTLKLYEYDTDTENFDYNECGAIVNRVDGWTVSFPF